MSVVKYESKKDGIVVHVRSCAECDSYIQGTDRCKKHGHTKPYCIDGRKTIKNL